MRVTPLFLAGLLATGTALAQDSIDFNRYDANRDGYLDPSEWSNVTDVTVEFDAIDTNRDGQLSEAEVKAGISETQNRNISRDISGEAQDATAETVPYDPANETQKSAEEQRAAMEEMGETEDVARTVALYDTDQDGRVSRSEAHKDGELVTYFVVWDTNQDGYLDQEEMDQGSQQVKPDDQDQGQDQQEQDMQGRQEGSGQGGTVNRTISQTMTDTGDQADPVDQWFEEADKDRDARISRIEANEANPEFLVVSFDDLDMNRDGYLDRTEAAASRTPEARETGRETGSGVGDNVTRFEAYDADADGFLTTDETASDDYLASNFASWDVNNDDRLDETEVGADWAQWNEDSFETYDVNDDGLLDENEVAEHDYIDYSFDNWDADRDGYVSEDEANTGQRYGDDAMRDESER